MSANATAYPGERFFWERVKARLPMEIVREVHARRPQTLARKVAIVDELRGARSWGLWADELSSWARAQEDARTAVGSLSVIDFRLGAWCACQIARTTLPHCAEGLPVIREVERWVRGNATRKVCQNAGRTLDHRYNDYSARRKDVAFRIFFTATSSAADCARAVGSRYEWRGQLFWNAVHNALALQTILQGNDDTVFSSDSRQIKAIAHTLISCVAEAIVTMPWELDADSIRRTRKP